MPLSIGIVASHNGWDPSGLTIVYNSNGTINSSIRGDIPAGWKNGLFIPGYVVVGTSATSIGSQSFRDNQLTSATIPDSVTSIGSYAFRSNRLTSVTIPDSVTNIGNYAFGNNHLASVTIPNSVRSFGDRLFIFNALTTVTVPDSVTSIGMYTFGRNQLTSATIPSSVTSIGTRSFAFNANLSNVNCYTTRTAFVGLNAFQSTASPLTLRVRTTDATWTAGTQSFQGNDTVNVVKDL